jgi:hypothetical protein
VKRVGLRNEFRNTQGAYVIQLGDELGIIRRSSPSEVSPRRPFDDRHAAHAL